MNHNPGCLHCVFGAFIGAKLSQGETTPQEIYDGLTQLLVEFLAALAPLQSREDTVAALVRQLPDGVRAEVERRRAAGVPVAETLN